MSKRGELVPGNNSGDGVTILSPYNPHSSQSHTLRQSLRSPTRIGLVLIFVFVMIFGVWGTLVPLAGGAIAPGIISPDGSRRTVQHLEGGIIRELHVRDGDSVEAGEPLLLLESVQPKANHDLHVKQQQTLLATRARLEAERLVKNDVEFPVVLASAAPEIKAVMSAQRELFKVRKASHEAKNRILRQRMAQLQEQIKGYQAQVTSASLQIDLIGQEIAAKRALAKKGHITKPELLRLLRMEAELGGRRGQYLSAISEAEQQIGETRLQLVANDTERADQVATQLDEVQAELNSIDEKLLSSRDILNRTVITAPVGGTIVNLQFKTKSGVIQPGVPILDIVPANEKLMIDARVSPMDIDVVTQGLEAQVQLTVLSARSAARINGVVISVSADSLTDEATSQAYYLARVEVDREEVARIGPDMQLIPGMPADVLIVTGERTMVSYLLRPFLDAVWKTLRET